VVQALSEIERGPLPALVVCHGVVIRLALTHYRPGRPAPRVPNAALIALGESATAPAPEPSLRAPTAAGPTSA
jgi:broad specificity phosphatase PhoE